MSLRAAIRADARGNQVIQSVVDSAGVLQPGSEQRAVRWLERMLGTAGFDPGKVDSRYDNKTSAALKGFQAAWGLEPTGKLDARTFAKLKATQDRVRDSQRSNPKHHVDSFGLGQKSDRVKSAEGQLRRLGYHTGAVDGVFDGDTARAVADFKKDQGNIKGGARLGEGSLKALRKETNAFEHAPTRGRTTKGLKEHRRLNAATQKAAGTRHPDGSVGIGLGAKGRAVKNVQAHLAAAGFDPKRRDGVFDERTEAALKAYQRKAGLDPTGKVGERTWKELEKSVILAKDGTSPAQRKGETSAAVKRSEEVLRKLGYKNVKVDGVFDKATQRASRRFEQKHPGVGKDGGIGAGQLERMKQVLQAKQHPGSGPTLKAGDRGGPVKELQQRLEKLGFELGQADGDFGKRTRAAVKRFQHSRGLEEDGVVGKKTWRALGIKVRGKVNHPGGSSGPGPIGSGSWPGITSKMTWAARVATGMGLTVTSTTGGTHAPGSYHYSGRAIDVAGSPSLMARYYRYMASKNPTELFYDPIGGIKYGQNIGAIGGHSDHVHIAF